MEHDWLSAVIKTTDTKVVFSLKKSVFPFHAVFICDHEGRKPADYGQSKIQDFYRIEKDALGFFALPPYAVHPHLEDKGLRFESLDELVNFLLL